MMKPFWKFFLLCFDLKIPFLCTNIDNFPSQLHFPPIYHDTIIDFNAYKSVFVRNVARNKLNSLREELLLV